MTDDAELLRRYAGEGAEDAFAEVVRRHVDMVYSAALRQVGGNGHRAKDVAQLVFADLARKADAVARRPVLAGWLFTATRFAAAKIVRGEQRRRARELEVSVMSAVLSEGDEQELAAWEKLRPVIDEALSALKEGDREAVLLRFFENRALADVGAKLGLNENAARMRVERALKKLRGVLARRGVTSTSAALGVVLSNQAVAAAPVGLAGVVGSAALAGVGAAASGVGSGAILSFMATIQTKGVLAVVLGVVAIGIGWQQYANERARARNAERVAVHNGALSELAALRQKEARIEAELAVLMAKTALDARPLPAKDEMDDPDYARVYSLTRRGEGGSLHLFRRLGLRGAEAEQMMDLLAERSLENARALQMLQREAKDIVTIGSERVARSTALYRDGEFMRRLEAVAVRATEGKIRAFLGEERYALYLAHSQPVLSGSEDIFKQRGDPIANTQLDRLQEIKQQNGGHLWDAETWSKERRLKLADRVRDDVKETLSPLQWDLLLKREAHADAERALQERNHAAAMGGHLKLLPSSEAAYRKFAQTQQKDAAP